MEETDTSRAGIGRKFHKPTVFPEYHVVENLELAMAGPRGVWSTLRQRLDRASRDHIDAVLDEIGLRADAHARGGAGAWLHRFARGNGVGRPRCPKRV